MFTRFFTHTSVLQKSYRGVAGGVVLGVLALLTFLVLAVCFLLQYQSHELSLWFAMQWRPGPQSAMLWRPDPLALFWKVRLHIAMSWHYSSFSAMFWRLGPQTAFQWRYGSQPIYAWHF